MAVDIRHPGTTACRVAGIDKQRFNEAVAAKRYPCAPEVKKGGTRTFNQDDMVALFVYARLIEQDMPASVAGEIACDLRSRLNDFPEATEVKVPRHRQQVKGPQGQETGMPLVDGEEYSVLIEMVFDVAGIRGEVERRLKKGTADGETE